MAKKRTKPKKASGESPFLESVKHYTTSKRVHFILGLLICFITIYTGIAMLSYFFTGAADQSVVNNLVIEDLFMTQNAVSNWAGIRGAYLSDLIINRWLGIPSFFLLFFAASLGAKLMGLCKVSLLKRFIICSLLTIWSSLLFAFIFSGFDNMLFFHLGGQHGNSLSGLLKNNIGSVGVILFLLAGLILIAAIINKQTISLLQSKLSFERTKEKITSLNTPPFATTQHATNEEFKENAEEEAGTKPTSVEFTNNDVETNVEEREQFTVEVAKGEEEEVDNLSEPGTYDPRLDLSSYRFPEINLLKKYDQSNTQVDMDEQNDNQRRIKKTLEDFGIHIVSIKATVGPTITLYEVVPDKGVRISKIRGLEDDIALSLSALGIRIIAPMPGKGTIGIEVPNKKPQIVSMESVVSSRKFAESKYELPVVLGRTITNELFMFDLTKTPHLLVAGATGQGKSVGLNVIIASLLYKKHPAELKFVLVDPKMVEFNIYGEIERHYLAKLPEMDHAIITDFNNVIETLKSLCIEMDNRYDLLMKAHVRNISEYNAKFISRRLNPEKGHLFMPYIVVIIDEFGDLIMTAGKEIEMPIARIAQKARAVGIHMIIATQRPSTNIITGTIKANFPVRVAFKVSSMIDSRTILDSPGANKLIGRGDLLFSQGNDTVRVQCALVSTDEIENMVKYIGEQTGFETAYKLPEVFDENQSGGGSSIDLSSRDPLFEDAARLIVMQQQGSTSLIQRKFSIGYNRAGRLMDQLEAAGIVGSIEGNKGRQVLIMDESSLDQKMNML